jgi:hypothetical protein
MKYIDMVAATWQSTGSNNSTQHGVGTPGYGTKWLIFDKTITFITENRDWRQEIS